jgi:hypothetical protein
MARTRNNDLLLKSLSGKLGGQLVFKQYGSKTVVTKYPDMRRVKRSRLQKLKAQQFKEAVVYAKSILRDPKKRKAYAKKVKRGKTVYHTAIAEYLKGLAHQGIA